MHTFSFEKLIVWQLARQLRKDIYTLTSSFPRHEIFGLTSQIRRSVSGIGDCLSEGSGRQTNKDKAHFVNMAYATALETLNHLIGALDLDYINEENYLILRNQLEIVTAKLTSLRQALVVKA